MMENLLAEAKLHFNEPILISFEVGRCVGYAEDDDDCYLLVRFPNPRSEKLHYCTFVGGYIYLDCLIGRGYVESVSGEHWDDFYRLDSWLALNGAPQEKEFICEIDNDFGQYHRERKDQNEVLCCGDLEL